MCIHVCMIVIARYLCEYSTTYTYLGSNSSDINRGELRLFNGNRTSGILEMLLDGEWKRICINFFSDLSANVSCKQLGYVGATEVLVKRRYEEPLYIYTYLLLLAGNFGGSLFLADWQFCKSPIFPKLHQT